MRCLLLLLIVCLFVFVYHTQICTARDIVDLHCLQVVHCLPFPRPWTQRWRLSQGRRQRNRHVWSLLSTGPRSHRMLRQCFFRRHNAGKSGMQQFSQIKFIRLQHRSLKSTGVLKKTHKETNKHKEAALTFWQVEENWNEEHLERLLSTNGN